MSNNIRAKAGKTTAGLARLFQKLDVQRSDVPQVLTDKEAIIPVVIVSVLFFLWGFAYGLLDTMNSHVRNVMHLQRTDASLLAVGYYTAYLICPFAIAGPLIKHCGYRMTFVTGLTIFGLGNFLVSVAAKSINFSGMVAGMFVVGSGISTLERSANPYAATCGPSKTSAIRLNLAQSAAGIGTVVAPFVAAQLLFGSAIGAEVAAGAVARANVESIVSLYNGVGAVVIGIALFFGFIFLRTKWVPEVALNQEAMSDEAVDAPVANLERYSYGESCWSTVRRHSIWSYNCLWLAVLANFFNVGCQVAVAQFFMEYCKEVAHGTTNRQASMYLSSAQAAFVVGRFAAAGLMCFVKDRKVLLLFNVGAFACTAAAIFARNTGGIVTLVMIMFFEGPLFPTIFATATTKGLGRNAWLGEGIMIVSISGGALLSPLVGLLADTKDDTPIGFVLIAASFVIVAVYSFSINMVSAYKRTMDTSTLGENEDTESRQLHSNRRSTSSERDDINRRSPELPETPTNAHIFTSSVLIMTSSVLSAVC